MGEETNTPLHSDIHRTKDWDLGSYIQRPPVSSMHIQQHKKKKEEKKNQQKHKKKGRKNQQKQKKKRRKNPYL